MSDPLVPIVVRQLRSIRELVDTTLALLGEDDAGEAPSGPCAHPLDQRVPAGAMGQPDRFFCRGCRQFVAFLPLQTSAPQTGAANGGSA